jgi:hypothetical protein
VAHDVLNDYTKRGDRDLAAWVSKNPPEYHFTTYTYTDLNGGGNPNVYKNTPYGLYLPLWHFIYFGYSR